MNYTSDYKAVQVNLGNTDTTWHANSYFHQLHFFIIRLNHQTFGVTMRLKENNVDFLSWGMITSAWCHWLGSLCANKQGLGDALETVCDVLDYRKHQGSIIPCPSWDHALNWLKLMNLAAELSFPDKVGFARCPAQEKTVPHRFKWYTLFLLLHSR